MVHELFPYLHVADGAAAIRFYEEAFGARELFRLTEPPTGRLGHAELDFGGSTLMVSDEYPECGIHGPKAGAPTSVSLHIHVDDADAVIAEPLPSAPRWIGPRRTRSTASARASCATPSATAGISAIRSRK